MQDPTLDPLASLVASAADLRRGVAVDFEAWENDVEAGIGSVPPSRRPEALRLYELADETVRLAHRLQRERRHEVEQARALRGDVEGSSAWLDEEGA
jgi:hypothetical protein